MGNAVVKRDVLAGYVHDAVNIEVKRHTLNKTRDELIKSRDKRLEEQERAVSVLNNKHESDTRSIEYELRCIEDKHSKKVNLFEERLKESENVIIKAEKEPLQSFDLSCTSVSLMIGFICGVLIGSVICAILIAQGVIDTNSEEVFIGSVLIGICGIIGVLIQIIIEKSKWLGDIKEAKRCAIDTAKQDIQKLQTEQQEELETYKKELSQKQSERRALSEQQQLERSEAENNLASEQKVYAELTVHIDCMSEKLEAMDSQLSEFYSIDLIPPDYRSIECVIAFDQMFRNDLVDTMREAALLYDERVFRGEMIKGLNNIYEAINELGGLMSETVSVLRQIESNTSRMCDELVDVSSNLVRMNANVTGHLSTMSTNLSSGLETISRGQSRIETELEYNRYANEAIRANSDRMRWYTEQRWQGLL